MKEVQVEVSKCVGCKSCELACAVEHSETKELFAAILEEIMPRKRVFVQAAEESSVPVNCRHCEEAFCVRVCPTGAMYRDKATATVQHNRIPVRFVFPVRNHIEIVRLSGHHPDEFFPEVL